MVYYGKLKKMWDELAVYKPITTCSCGELAQQLEEDRNEEKTNTFLNGLDTTRFGTVRSTITSIEPLPKLTQVYQRIVREERQQTIARNRETPTEVVGFSANPGNRFASKETVCGHCGKTGHTKLDCYQLIGYPEYWGERGRDFSERGRGGRGHGRFGRGGGAAGRSGGRGTYGRAHMAQMPHVSANSAKKESSYDRHSLPQLNDDQWTALLSFLSSQKSENAESSEKLNGKKKYAEFIIDTGASHHMTWNLSYLSNITDIAPCDIGLPDGKSALAIKQGDLCLGGDLWLKGVLYSKDLTCSLISVAKLLKAVKGSITFTDELCILQDRTTKTLIGAGEECGGVYVFRGVIGTRIHKAMSSRSHNLWHRRLGHPSSRVLSYLSSTVEVGKLVESDLSCDICLRAKQTRDSFHESSNKADGVFDLIHCDIWGAYRTLSSNGSAYFLTIVDDYSRAVWIYLLKDRRRVKLLEHS